MNHVLSKHVLLSLLYVSFLSVLSIAAAQQGAALSPKSIIVNPAPSYQVEVFVDRDSSGNAIPSYAVGEQIRIGVRVSEDAYIYLFNVRSDGSVNQILPNNYDAPGQNNFLQAGETKYFPPENSAYSFQVQAPEGLDKVIAVASQTQLDTSTLANFENDPNFASSTIGESGFADALSIIVEPLPQANWVTDTALFYVGNAAPPEARYGTLVVTSAPAGAKVLVDDTFVGYTPLSYGTTSGNHIVNVELAGYNTYEATINVTGGQTREVQVSLSPLQQLGQVGFESDPSGAQVYVDDQFIGTTPTGTITLPAGEHQARFVRSGFDDTYLNFTVQADGYQVVSGALRAQQGVLELTGNVGGALVYIDGTQVGTIPSGSGRLTLEALSSGTHELTVIAPGFSTVVSEFNIAPGQTTPVSVSQSRR